MHSMLNIKVISVDEAIRLILEKGTAALKQAMENPTVDDVALVYRTLFNSTCTVVDPEQEIGDRWEYVLIVNRKQHDELTSS